MKTVDRISVEELAEMSKNMYGSLVKAVVDLERQLLVVDAEIRHQIGQLVSQKVYDDKLPR